jgi:hypothetical protein
MQSGENLVEKEQPPCKKVERREKRCKKLAEGNARATPVMVKVVGENGYGGD